MVASWAEQLHHRGVRGEQESGDELWAGEEQGAEDAVELQPDARRERQELVEGRGVNGLLESERGHFPEMEVSEAAWSIKGRQLSIKVAQNDSTRKMKDFDTFTKIACKYGWIWQNNYFHRL